MAVSEKTQTDVEQTTEESPRYRITPRYGVWTENKKVILQVALPGVKKADVNMKALKDFFTLRALRGDYEYALDLDFGIEIEPNKTKSHYEEGLLKVEFERYNPLDHAFEVKIE